MRFKTKLIIYRIIDVFDNLNRFIFIYKINKFDYLIILIFSNFYFDLINQYLYVNRF